VLSLHGNTKRLLLNPLKVVTAQLNYANEWTTRDTIDDLTLG